MLSQKGTESTGKARSQPIRKLSMHCVSSAPWQITKSVLPPELGDVEAGIGSGITSLIVGVGSTRLLSVWPTKSVGSGCVGWASVGASVNTGPGGAVRVSSTDIVAVTLGLTALAPRSPAAVFGSSSKASPVGVQPCWQRPYPRILSSGCFFPSQNPYSD